MQLYKPLVIDLQKKNYTLGVTAMQFDVKSRYLSIQILNNNKPEPLTNHTVRIYGAKKDGTKIFNDCIITDAANGKLDVEITSQFLSVAAPVECELTISGADNSILTTQTFTLTVESIIRDDAALESSNEYKAFENALAQVQNIDNRFNQVNEDLRIKAKQVAKSNCAPS